MLFYAVGKKIIRLVASDSSETVGCEIAGEYVWNIMYTVDITLLAKAKEDPEQLTLSVEEQSERMGLKINRDETKVLTLQGTCMVQ